MGHGIFGNQTAQLEDDARAIRDGIERLEQDRQTDTHGQWMVPAGRASGSLRVKARMERRRHANPRIASS